MGDQEGKGLVFDIQGHSIHDGPGTRTTVFLAGCPLACIWCCNPEGLRTRPVLLHMEGRCKGSRRCIPLCPHDAISLQETGKPLFDRSFCDVCSTHDCVAGCFNEALTVSGRWMSPDELMKIFARDRHFWGARGGMTLSGGEALMQKEFALDLLGRCRAAQIHTCVETNAYHAPAYFLEALKSVDWVFVDIKQMDPVRHEELTGVSNDLILDNIRNLAGSDWPGVVVIRVPVIPGCNDSEENIRATARFVKNVGLEVINLLPFHRLGESKYRQLGQQFRFQDTPSASVEDLAPLKKIVEEEGLLCYPGWQTPF